MQQYVKILDFGYKLGTDTCDVHKLEEQFITPDNPKEKVREFTDQVLGRDTIHRFSKEDNPVEMCTSIAYNLMQKNYINPKDIDMLICTSCVSEYYAPTEALILHNRLGLRDNVKLVMDLNVDCAGFLSTIYIVNSIMAVDPEVKNVLVLDVEIMGHLTPKRDIVTELGSSDCACAMLLQKRNTPTDMYMQCLQDTSNVDAFTGPVNGMFNFVKSNDYNQFRVDFKSNVNCNMDWLVEQLQVFAEKYHICLEDVAYNCFSQCTLHNVKFLRDKLNLPKNKTPYVVRNIGYTGPSSPLIALYDGVEKGKVKRGDKLLCWTIAVGIQHILMYLEY